MEDLSKLLEKYREFKYDGDTYRFPYTPQRLGEIRKFSFKENDGVVATYSKSGTSWMKYIAYLILNDGPMREMLMEAAPYMDFVMFTWEALTNRPSPRLFVTHVPAKYLEREVRKGKVKILHVRRNPRDTLVSLYHFYRSNMYLGRYEGTWDEFFEMYRNKTLIGGDIFEHNSGWWGLKDLPNVFSTTFEEMKRHPVETVRRVGEFIGVNLSEDRIQEIAKEASFNRMKDNHFTNIHEAHEKGTLDFDKAHFYRKGEVGDWRNYLTEEQSHYVEEQEQKAKDQCGLSFDYE